MLKISSIVLIVLIILSVFFIIKAIHCCIKKGPSDALTYVLALLVIYQIIPAAIAIFNIIGI